jgi:molecular chaperone DnaK (HSP70)
MAGKGEWPAIGIDLGTTYSCVAVWQHDRVEIIVNDQGNRTTPSYVAFTDKERLVGDAAQNQVARNPANSVFGKSTPLFFPFLSFSFLFKKNYKSLTKGTLLRFVVKYCQNSQNTLFFFLKKKNYKIFQKFIFFTNFVKF